MFKDSQSFRDDGHVSFIVNLLVAQLVVSPSSQLRRVSTISNSSRHRTHLVISVGTAGFLRIRHTLSTNGTRAVSFGDAASVLRRVNRRGRVGRHGQKV